VSTLSNYTQELLLSHFPGASEKIFLTPGALRSDFAVVPPQPAPRKDKIVILTVGRLHPRKGQMLTLQALQMLPREVRSRLEYWIVGAQSKGNYEQLLRSAAAEQPELVVRFFGNLPDDELAGVYDSADIFAMTSVNLDRSIEGFGLVYLEAAAHGLPVVAHDVGGVAEAVMDNVTGLLVPPNRPAQLAAAFEKLIHDAELRKKLGAAGREWAMRNCWKESAEALFNPHWAAA
jgi:glycosyltransferase involved in cell wall biosynthesis